MLNSPSGECKCWKLSCEHIALSVMCHFLVGSQELYFPSFLCCSPLQACHYTWLIFENLAHTHTRMHARTHARAQQPRATTNDVRFGRRRGDGADWWERTRSERGKPPEPPSAGSEAPQKLPVSCCVYPRALTQWPS